MIGVIVKTELDADELSLDWVPEALDINLINSAFQDLLGYTPSKEQFTHDVDSTLIHFTIDDMRHPKAIAFSCTASSPEAELINSLAEKLNAKIYDSEMCEFIQL